MDGSVLSFLKAEWKVSDTGSVGGSAHWASSFLDVKKTKELEDEMARLEEGNL